MGCLVLDQIEAKQIAIRKELAKVDVNEKPELESQYSQILDEIMHHQANKCAACDSDYDLR
ncbi:MAG TPA: hypothetical protein VK638_55040 [Edaphobacter sp.]|nr:hypothetical protein [Edaphobacter sp.]